jgi:hypothetical protein
LVATAEKILNRKPGGFASRRSPGALCAFAVQESAKSEKSVDQFVPSWPLCRCGRNQRLFVERSADSYTITEPNSTGGAPITVGQETIQ